MGKGDFRVNSAVLANEYILRVLLQTPREDISLAIYQQGEKKAVLCIPR